LLAELAQVRRTGLAVNDEEMDSGLRAIAVPIRSRSGAVVAAINLAFPWSPAPMSELTDQFGPLLFTTARAISSLVI
jgi:IclR family pca regulon transcriptional regulator